MFGIEAAFEGRLGRDPELKMVKGGTMPMLTLAIAADEAPPKDGQERHGLSLLASEAKALGKVGRRKPRPEGQRITEQQRRSAADSQRPLDRNDEMQNDPLPW